MQEPIYKAPVIPMPALTHRQAARWLKDNLFSTWYNSLLTLFGGWVAYLAVRGLISWIVYQANWTVVTANFQLLLIGTYPRSQVWRLWLVAATIALLGGLSIGVGRIRLRWVASVILAGSLLALGAPLTLGTKAWIICCLALLGGATWLGRSRPQLRVWILLAWVLAPIVILLLLRGIPPFLTRVNTSQWGGLTVTLMLAAASILLSFPLGILLALGRRSKLPIVSLICTAYIETFRGLPLIAILFMSQVMTPIFLPGIPIDRLLRAMIGFTLSTSAYTAENVRGGLQSIGRGQHEAAQALGLSGPLTMVLIILPQALRAAIPSTVGQFISLFKDTSLVAVVGLMDLMGISRSVIANPDWLGLQAEVFVFAALIYWIFCFTMSYASQRIEHRMGGGDRC